MTRTQMLSTSVERRTDTDTRLCDAIYVSALYVCVCVSRVRIELVM